MNLLENFFMSLFSTWLGWIFLIGIIGFVLLMVILVWNASVTQKAFRWFTHREAWLILWTAILASATIYSSIILRDTDHTLRDTLTATERPWVTASVSILSDLIFDDTEARVRLQIKMKNTGHSPAADVSVFPVMLLTPPQKGMTYLEMEKAVCSDFNYVGLAPDQGLGYTLFPDGIETVVATAKLKRPEIEHENKFYPTIIACINYRFTFTDERHKTAIAFRLGKIKLSQVSNALEGSNELLGINFDKGNVPVRRLGLVLLGSYAD